MGAIPNRAHQIATSANDKKVYIDLTRQPLAATISRNPHMLRLIEEVVRTYNLRSDNAVLEHDMERSVGYCDILETTEADAVFYGRLLKAEGYTRFVKNRQTKTSQFLTINLSKDTDGDYEITNAWVGKAYPPSPDDPAATAQSKTFWENHAVVYNGQAIIANTLTKTSPY